MHKLIVYTAYGWLVLSGVLQFVIDVLFQHLRGKRIPSPETTLYYGLNSAFSLGQVIFGLICLWIAWRSIALLNELPILILSTVAACIWLIITLLFMEYWEPKLNAAIFCVLITTVVFSAR